MYLGRNSDGRLPFVSQCDVHVSHVIRPRARTSVTLSLNVVNLLNQDTINNYYPTELFAGQNVAVGEAQYLQGVDMQTLIAEQQLVRDARFLLPSGFQPPRTMRVGMSISF